MQQFELTKDYVSDLREAIEKNDEKFIIDQLSGLHPVDIAEIFNELSTQEAMHLYKSLDVKKAADVLIELDEDIRDEFLKILTPKEIARQFIENLESDDAADIIARLPESIREEVIAYIEDVEQASDIVDLLHYEEGTAGALMGKELIKANLNWTVVKCVKEMRKQAQDVQSVFTVYVTDDNDKLLGTLSLKRLLLTPAKAKVADIYNPDVIFVKTTTKSEEIAQVMEKYDLVALPVVDDIGRLVGRITIDDVVDVMKEEADEDYRMASGISESVESTDTVWLLSRARLPWLVIALLGGVFSAQIVGIFEEEIRIYPEMAFFMPLIAAMGGNVGVQSSAIVVRAIANKSAGFAGIVKRLIKEFSVALFNGIICSALILAYNIAFYDAINLGLTVSVALLSVMVFAGLFGTFVPLFLDKMKIDPALATGPFITTTNDILGITMYFVIGRMMYMG